MSIITDTDAPTPTPDDHPADRRRTPRVEIVGQLQGEIIATATAVHVREVGLGGFSVETQDALIPGTTYEFRLTLNNWTTVEVSARVIHCQLRPAAQGKAAVYVSGLQFLDQNSDGGKSPVALLFDGITAGLSFD